MLFLPTTCYSLYTAYYYYLFKELDEEMWEQMSPRVYRNLDEIFAGEYEVASDEAVSE